jgi:hypothetical protein
MIQYIMPFAEDGEGHLSQCNPLRCKGEGDGGLGV